MPARQHRVMAQVMVTEPFLVQLIPQGCKPRSQIVDPIAIKLDQEDGNRVALEEVAEPACFGIQSRAVKHVLIHDLHRGRAMLEYQRSRGKGFEQIGELDDQRRAGARPLDELELGLDRDPERSFRADKHAGEIEATVCICRSSRRDRERTHPGYIHPHAGESWESGDGSPGRDPWPGDRPLGSKLPPDLLGSTLPASSASPSGSRCTRLPSASTVFSSST